jgi:hypothetical protein
MSVVPHFSSQRLHSTQTGRNTEDANHPGRDDVWLGERFPEMAAPQSSETQTYMSANTARVCEKIVRTHNFVEFTVAQLTREHSGTF